MTNTDTLRTQYVDDLVKQRQLMEAAMIFQNSPVEPGEGFSTMVPKVKALTGRMPKAPVIGFAKQTITSLPNFNINSVKKENMRYIFANCFQQGSESAPLDLSLWNIKGAKDLSYMFSKEELSKLYETYMYGANKGSYIKLGAMFDLSDVETLEMAFAPFNYNSSTMSVLLYNLDDVPNVNARKLKNIKNYNGCGAYNYKYTDDTKHPYKLLTKLYNVSIEHIDGLFRSAHTSTSNRVPCSFFRKIGALSLMEHIIKNWDTSKLKSMSDLYKGLSVVDDLYVDSDGVQKSTIQACVNFVARLNTSSVVDITNLFSTTTHTSDVITSYDVVCDLSNCDFSSLENVDYAFYSRYFSSIIVGPCLSGTLKRLYYTFGAYGSNNLHTINAVHWDLSNVNYMYEPFRNRTNLVDLYFGKNLGKGFNSTTANYSYHTVYLSSASMLSVDSVLRLFNNIYDLNKTYDVENGGTLATQKIDLHADVIAKLTPEEIAIATNKGWSVV